MSEITYVPAKLLYGTLNKGPSSFNVEEGSGAQFASNSWHAFVDKLIAHGVPLDQEQFGVSWPADNQVPPQEIYYFCGVEYGANSEDFEQFKVEGGNYFAYGCKVPQQNLDQGFQEAYMVALPASGLTPREGQHLEIYGSEYDPNSPIARFQILIPVK